MNHTQGWFLRRVDKRIYRDKTSCPCETCKRGFENGLVVHDKQHAIYLYDCQFCDEVLNYRDKF